VKKKITVQLAGELEFELMSLFTLHVYSPVSACGLIHNDNGEAIQEYLPSGVNK
jgi:hypothetical protein